MERLLRDIRFAARAMSKKPGVTALALLSLALAIGFSTAGFSVLDAMLLRDAPFRDPKSLAEIYVMTREQRPDELSWTEYQALATRAHSFTDVVAEDRQGPMVRLPDRDDFPITGEVSDNYFDALGVQAARGDVFHAGKGRDQTVVISDHYWKQALGGDPAIIGRSLAVGRASLEVIGVLAPGFSGTRRGLLVDLFVPVQVAFGALATVDPADTKSTDFELAGHLRAGVTLDQARAETDAILRQLERDGREPGPERRAGVGMFVEQQRAVKILYLSTLLLLIVVAAANVANLRLVDNESRRRETGIKLALGAGRTELARAHLTETFLLSALGTAGGLAVTAWLIRLAPALFYGGKRYMDYGIRLDARTIAFSSVALLVVMLLSALIPLRDAWSRRMMPGVQGTRTTRSSRWLTGLVIAQMAVVTGIACSAALLWRSLENVSAIRPAMDTSRKLLMIGGFFEKRDESAARTVALAANLAELPGVERVAWARRAMLSGSGGGSVVQVAMPGQPEFSFRFNQVSPNYFATTGARILAGRGFGESDGPDATKVVMVNATFARRLFGDRRPVGEWVKVNGKERQIVGIVEDGPSTHLKEPPAPYLYLPFAQMPTGELTLLIESRRDPGLLTDSVRSAIRLADKSFRIFDTTTMAQHMRVARSEELLASELTGGLAVLGMLLAAAGLFGVSLFAVKKRMPEFGVRMAMGATSTRLLGQVFAEAWRRMLIAIPLGWALAFAARHALETQLYGVAATDPWTLIAAGAAVALVGCCAALYPAISAARVDPMTALRHE